VDDQLRGSLGNAGATALQDMIAHARKPEKNVVASILGVAMLLFGAGGVFGQLQDALNTVWGVKRRSGRGLKGILKDRFLSFAMVLGTGFLLLTSMVVSAVLQGLSEYMGSILSLPPALWAGVSAVVSFVVIAALFAAIFKLLPDVQIEWRDVFSGALFTAALFTIGKFALAWYLGREATASAYGATGALAIVLLWVYYSSIILLFGAEFTQVAAVQRGGAIRPDRDAVLVDDDEDESKEKAVRSSAPVDAVGQAPSAVGDAGVAPARVNPGPLVWMAGTVVPVVAGWSMGPAIKAKVGEIIGRSPLLRASVASLGRLRAKHPKLVKLAMIGAVVAARRGRKSRV